MIDGPAMVVGVGAGPNQGGHLFRCPPFCLLVGDTKPVMNEPCRLGKIVLSPCVPDVNNDAEESAFIIYCYDVADEL